MGLAARRAGVDLDDETVLADVAGRLAVTFEATGDSEDPLIIRLAGDVVTRAIRTDEAGRDASLVARFAAVRTALGDLQQGFRQPPGLVADGRDMGTVVFPDAEVKIFLTATAEERAARRYKQLIVKDIDVNLADLLRSIRARDEQDMNRAVAPLVAAEDAFVIDSTHLGIDDVFAQVLSVVTQRLG